MANDIERAASAIADIRVYNAELNSKVDKGITVLEGQLMLTNSQMTSFKERTNEQLSSIREDVSEVKKSTADILKVLRENR